MQTNEVAGFLEESGTVACGTCATWQDPAMEWLALGDSGWLHIAGHGDACARFHAILSIRDELESCRIPEALDIVPASESIAVHCDISHGAMVYEWLCGRDWCSNVSSPSMGVIWQIPVDYHQPCSELTRISEQVGLPSDEVLKRHCAPLYQVTAMGFSPGFPYLSGLDPALALPRKSTPGNVPAGAVAISSHHAGIYPQSSPGGWHVIGRTDSRLFEPDQPCPSLFTIGDRVRFIPARLPSRVRPHPPARNPPSNQIEVLNPGTFTTIQDSGRPGLRAMGVTAGGAMDPVSMSVANALVGNPASAAVLECAGCGPVLRFHQDLTVAIIGWQKGSGVPYRFGPGDILDLRSRMKSTYGFVAFAGGLDVPRVLGSCGTDVRAGFGGVNGRTLRAGDFLDTLPARHAAPTPGGWHVSWPRYGSQLELRYIEGIQSNCFDSGTRRKWQDTFYQIGSRGNRTAMRLIGPSIQAQGPVEMVSQPVVPGSIQIPPDGQPTVLLSECQTIGGYPQIGHVISADLPALCMALPGTKVRFRKVDLEEARAAWHDRQLDLSRLKTWLRHFP